MWNFSQVRTIHLKPVRLAEPKVCPSCNAIHIATPPMAITCLKGYLWFHCSCGSTLIVRSDLIITT
jgi:hypothetical protein